MTVLAFRTELVQVLWNFMKQCNENKKWPSLHEQLSYLPGDVPGWLLPLAVFCPVYKSASLSPFVVSCPSCIDVLFCLYIYICFGFIYSFLMLD